MDPRYEPIDPLAVYLVADVAEVVHCDRRVIRRAIKDGSLPAFIPNGCTKGVRILGKWILDWMERGAQGSGETGAPQGKTALEGA